MIGKQVKITLRKVVGNTEENRVYSGEVTAIQGNLIQITNCKLIELRAIGDTYVKKEEFGIRWFNSYASGFLYMDEC